MKILRADMKSETVHAEELPDEWLLWGGSRLISQIMNDEVLPGCDPLGPRNKLIISGGPLAGTLAPQLGRVSVGAKSPLTYGIKEANSGGPAAQQMDRLGYRALIIENQPAPGKKFLLKIDHKGAELIEDKTAAGMKNYELVDYLHSVYGTKISVICTGIAGERIYRGASVSMTDMTGDPSRNAARGGLGAVMGSKGLKAVVIDAKGAGRVSMEQPDLFRETVRAWADVLEHDISCALFKKMGTPFAVANSANQGTMPYRNFSSGRPENFNSVSAEAIQKNVFDRGGKMHGCMPGCMVKCSIFYPGKDGHRLAAAFEYEAIALLGTNLGIDDPDAVARLKFACDDLGLDAIETGASLGVAADAGKMKMGDEASAMALIDQVAEGTELGIAIGNGVVSTASFLGIKRVPAYKGQAIPGHDPRAVKGTGVTYFTSPMGADHTAGLTYRTPKAKSRQGSNSLRAQVQSAVCDSFGYCINAVPGGNVSLNGYLVDLVAARFGRIISENDVLDIAKETLRQQLKFNKQAEFANMADDGDFFSTEAINEEQQVFDVAREEVDSVWSSLDGFKEQKKIWEIRIPHLPDILTGQGVLAKTGKSAAKLGMTRPLIVTDPFMKSAGRVDELIRILEQAGLASDVFDMVVPDPPVETVEAAGRVYLENSCDGLIGLGGGSSMDCAKAVALRVSHEGEMTSFESIVGGTAKIKPVLPPLVCIPTTSGTGSEVNPYAVITDKKRDLKFMLYSNHLIPKLAVIDPVLCSTMPPGLTVESGIDALAHCIEGYVSLATAYHPYFESFALYGTKLIGRSLPKSYHTGTDMTARQDMCLAAVFGGIAFLKGLGVGHALTHALGAHYHLPHGRAAMYGLLAFARANKKICKEPFTDLAFALNRNMDLETALLAFYEELDISISLKNQGIPESELPSLAFYTYKDAVNMATNPAVLTQNQVLSLVQEMY